MAIRSSEPAKSLKNVSIQPRQANTRGGERKKRNKAKPKRYTYDAFICFLYENGDEIDAVSEFLKKQGYNCTNSSGDIAPNRPEYQQISERMTQSHWIVLMFSKESFLTSEDGRLQYLISTAIAIAVSRNRKCLIPVLQGNIQTFVPEELSPYPLVDLNNRDCWATFLRLMDKTLSLTMTESNTLKSERHLASKACPQKVQAKSEHMLLQHPEDDIRRFSMPVDMDKSLKEILKKTRFSQPLKNILATVRRRKRLKMVQSLSAQGSLTARHSSLRSSQIGEKESQRNKQMIQTKPGLRTHNNVRSSKLELVPAKSSLSLNTTVQHREERKEKFHLEQQFKETHFRLKKIN